MFPFFVLAVLALATHRITRFITRDQLPVIAVPRDAFVNRWAAPDLAGPGGVIDVRLSITDKPTNIVMRSLAYLWECDWCTSVWVGGILSLITAQAASLPLPWLMWPAVSSIAGLIAQREPD